MTRIPITGIGVIAPGAIAAVERFDTGGLSAHTAALVQDFKPKDYIAPMKMRRMNTLSRLAMAAAKLAIEDCGAVPGANTGVALGTSFGPVQTSVDYMQEYIEKGAALAPPQLFAESVANAPGSHIAIEWGLRGFNITITQRESSALAAAMYACIQLAKGTVDAALIGGIEEVNEMLFSVLDRLGALDDAQQRGMVIGEGSAVLVVGSAGTREPYGWLSGFGVARDTTASISDWGTDAESVVRAMKAAIDDAEITAADIDAVYVSANGSPRCDALESRALALLFDRVPETVRTKQIFGEYAAGGALQLVEAVRGVKDRRHVLVNSLSAGGGIVCAVVSR